MRSLAFRIDYLRSHSTYFLPTLTRSVEVRCQHLGSDILQPVAGHFGNSRQWRQSLHEAAALVLHAICGILADLVDERNGLDRGAGFEKDYW